MNSRHHLQTFVALESGVKCKGKNIQIVWYESAPFCSLGQGTRPGRKSPNIRYVCRLYVFQRNNNPVKETPGLGDLCAQE